MISMLRKDPCSGSLHDLAHIPTQDCWADCLTKASTKADNLITTVKTGRLLDVDIHPNFRTLMGHKAFLSTWCRTFDTLNFPFTPTQREESFVRDRYVCEQNELNMCEFEGQDATKITSASADSRIKFSWMMRSLWVRTLCWCLVLMTNFPLFHLFLSAL